MAFPSRKETYDSNTPSELSSRTSMNGAQHRRSSKRTTIRSYQGSISNSSVHTTSTAATRNDIFDNSENGPGGAPSIDGKSFHSLEKSIFRFRNQSQSTVSTIREAGSVGSHTATSSSEQEIRSLNMPSFEGEDESSLHSSPRSSLYSLSTLHEPSPSSSRIYGDPPSIPLDDPSTKPYGDSPEPPQAAPPTDSVWTHSRTHYSSNHSYPHPPAQPSSKSNPGPPPTLYHSGSTTQRPRGSSRAGSTSYIDPATIPNLPPPLPLPTPSSIPPPLPHTEHQQQQQPKPKPIDTEHRGQQDGKPGLRTWWRHITTTQKPRPHASSENAHARSKAQALAQVYVPPPPGVVFGRPLKDSLRCASVQISTLDATGNLYIYGYIPVVVAKWCVHVLFISLVLPFSFCHWFPFSLRIKSTHVHWVWVVVGSIVVGS